MLGIKLEDAVSRRVSLIDHIMRYYDAANFNEALVALTAWGMWNDDVGTTLYERLRTGYGLPASPIDSPGQFIFERGEFADCVAVFTFFSILSWDAYLIPSDARFILNTSNDDILDVTIRVRSMSPLLQMLSQKWGGSIVHPAQGFDSEA